MRTLQERIQRFIEKCKLIHSDKNYDYSKVPETYVNNRTNVCIIDRDLKPDGTEYGPFYATPSNLLKGKGNGARRGERISKTKSMTAEEYFARAKEVHKDENLDYSKAEYKGLHEKILIIDHDIRPDGTEYGEYWQEANSHLRGCSHPQKAVDRNTMKQRDTREDFIRKANMVHNNKYTYDKTMYIDSRTDVIVTCPIHGDFKTMPTNHISGKGYPMCGNNMSVAEDEIIKYIQERMPDIEVVSRDRSVLGNMELDIYIPSKKFAIEYDGIKWHTEQYGKGKDYHISKLEACKEKGVTLIHIFEDEYIYKKELVLSKIGHMLSLDNGLPRVAARKCVVRNIDKDMADDFLLKYHLQGKCDGTVRLGCFYEEKLVGVMVFTKEFKNSDKWILNRFATDTNYVCQGVGGKLFRHFVNEMNPETVKTFLDRRLEHNPNGNLYTTLGFKIDAYEKPNYSYTNGRGVRLHKFGFRKNVLHRKYGLPLSMTEKEMTEKLGYWRIWDCGLIRYVWKNKE